MTERRWKVRPVTTRAWMLVVLCSWIGCWATPEPVDAGPSAASGLRLTGPGPIANPDDIVLVDDTVVEGTVVRRVLSNVVVRRGDGVEELIPARLIKQVRRVGELEPVTLAEILGESGADGQAEREQPPPETRQRATAAVLLLDTKVDVEDTDGAIESLWTQARAATADAVVIGVVDAELSLDVVEALGRRMGSLPAAAHRILVLGTTSHPTLALAVHAEEVWWVKGKTMQFETLDHRQYTRLERLMEGRIPVSLQRAMASRGTIGVDAAGRWLAEPATGGVSVMDAALAMKAGLAAREIRECAESEIDAGLDAAFDWEIGSTSLARLAKRAGRDNEAAERQIDVAESLIRDIAMDVAEIRTAAKEFDALYAPTRFHIRRIWLQDSTWRSVDDKNRSLDAQAKVKKAIRSLESHCRRLQGVAGRLSKDDPEGRRIFECWRRIQEVVDGLIQYKRSIERNQPETYEAERAKVLRLEAPGC